MKTRIQSISELALWVDDIERAMAFYQKLGFETESVDANRNAFLRSGDFLLVLFNPQDPGTALANNYVAERGGPGNMPRGGVYHAAFRVEPTELDEFAAELQKQGVAVKGPIEFASGRRSYFLEDPDEHYIELTDC
jgi:catechol 2,3-dioxygenase-like lactoylglutathione lyase family enzyme